MSEVVTSVSAVGTVFANFDTASFSLNFHELAPKAKLSKEKLKEGVDRITRALDILTKNGLSVCEGSLVTNVSVRPHSEYDRKTGEQVDRGMMATYSVSFNTQTLEMVNEVYDTLSDLPLNKLVVNSPSFSVKEQAALKDRALELAWTRVQEKFAFQCKTLGLDSRLFRVVSWSVDTEHSSNFSNARGMMYEGAVAAAAPMGGSSPIQLEAGQAQVQTTLYVNYAPNF